MQTVAKLAIPKGGIITARRYHHMLKKLSMFTKRHNKLTLVGIFILGGIVTLYAVAAVEYATRDLRNEDSPQGKALDLSELEKQQQELNSNNQQPEQQVAQTPTATTNTQTALPATQQPTKTAASIAADEASASAKELSRCIALELNEWQTFTTKQKQANDYRQSKVNEYQTAYNNKLITLSELDDLATKAYDLANSKIRQAYQTYYDTMIGSRCTNVKPMPQLYYWNY